MLLNPRPMPITVSCLRCKYVQKFSEFCCDNDIEVEMFPLEAVGDTEMVS